jgi:Transposase.
MAKQYTQDFKDMIVELHASGVGPGQLSKDYDVGLSTVNKWVNEKRKQTDKVASEEEIAEMRAKMLRQQQEIDVLKKALGIFARQEK